MLAQPHPHGLLELGNEPVVSDQTPISSYFEHAQRCVYTYDFGDNWEHLVLCHKKRPELEEVFWRRLKGGEGSGAPEDCGGAYGLEELVELKQKPAAKLTSDQRERLEWYTQDGWPEPFDLEEMKRDFDMGDVSQYQESFPPELPPIDWALFDPKLQEVCGVLQRVMNKLGESAETIEDAHCMWERFVQLTHPAPRKLTIYAASLHYTLRLLNFEEVSQAHIAKEYGTSASSISEVYPRMHQALDPSPMIDMMR